MASLSLSCSTCRASSLTSLSSFCSRSVVAMPCPLPWWMSLPGLFLLRRGWKDVHATHQQYTTIPTIQQPGEYHAPQSLSCRAAWPAGRLLQTHLNGPPQPDRRHGCPCLCRHHRRHRGRLPLLLPEPATGPRGHAQRRHRGGRRPGLCRSADLRRGHPHPQSGPAGGAGRSLQPLHRHRSLLPTRAALLTGLNHHSAGVGWLSEWEMGFPGYRGELRPDVATLPEILREHGFATLMVGKWHLTLSEHRSQTGPFDSWPTHRGFDRYWGFLDGETSQWHPHMLVEGTAQFLPPEDEEFYLPDALTDQAIGMIRDLRSLDPDQPFFLYYATGAPHAPHHTRASDRARYQGHYNEGYDVIRERRLARQKQLGLLPEHTRLTERNPGIVPWEELSADQQRMYARLQENYAAFVDNMDQNIGRLRDYLARIGELDNTIFLFLSDNGASREVGIEGSANVLRFFHHRPLATPQNPAYFDRIGEPETPPHYPQGWMQVSNTPFAHGKRTSWAGGVRVPFMLSWPAGLETSQPLRHQFHHVNDVAPTLLELLDIAPPERVGGRRVRPMEGISMAYSLRDPELPSRKQGQYYEVEAQRAYIEGDWKIVSYREDDEPYDARPWMLFNLSDDPAETQDLAARYPDRVEALSKAWWAAARRYDVLPLADVPLLERAFRFRRTAGDDRREWRLEPGTTPILEI